jgi:hypothetical protein
MNLAERLPSWVITAGRAAAVLALYVGASWLSERASGASGLSSPVWLPAGVALFALVRFGPGLWPAVLLAKLRTTGSYGLPWSARLTIAVGVTLAVLWAR